jgi:hypothetical protein
MGHFGAKKVEAPSKNSKKCPITCFAPDKKKIICWTIQNQRYIAIFMSQKERERGGEGERERERGGEMRESEGERGESERKSERKRKRERKRKKKRKREQKCGRLYF